MTQMTEGPVGREEILQIQRALARKGFDPGRLDGIFGPATSKALIAFKVSIGLMARDRIGPLTRAALFGAGSRPVGADRTVISFDSAPAWLARARTYLGLEEYRGARHNPKIIGWWIRLGLPFRNDETPWCAGFVCGVLEECGIRSPRSAAARSFHWTRWGNVLSGPAVGAVVCFWRGAPKGGSGHVGFVIGRDHEDQLMVLGGNQGDRVSIRPFSTARVLSYHWPLDVPGPANTGLDVLPVVPSDGFHSTKEV